MRILLSCLLFLLLPSFAAEPTKRVASEKKPPAITRTTTLPAWAQPVTEIPSTSAKDPIVLRLLDTQVKVAKVPTVFVNRAIQINSQTALSEIGQYYFEYNPSFEKVSLHRVMILRAGQQMDHLKDVDVRQMQREAMAENGVYLGVNTVQLLISDVRVGDTLWLTYSIEGANPVFGNLWADDFTWDGFVPVELRRLTILHPRQRKIHWRQIGDFPKQEITPQIDEIGELRRLRFEGRAIAPIENEVGIPTEFLPVRRIQFSEYKDWQDVARWADGLFPPQTLSPELKKLLAKFDQAATPAEKAAAALYWVQNEIRYFSLAIGENSHRPQTASTVLERRYGDCKDKSYLLVSLLNGLGIEAKPVLVAAKAPRFPEKVYPSPTFFDHAIVQIKLDGKEYYVDPTRTGQAGPLATIATAVPNAKGLVVASNSQQLSNLPDDVLREPRFELIENITVEAVDGDAKLVNQIIFRGMMAEAARQHFPNISESELKKYVLALYEKNYPGVSLHSTPSLRDISAENRYEIHAQLTLPKPITLKDERYSFEYDSQIFKNTLNLPDKVVRNFPLQMQTGKHHARYRLNLTWPEGTILSAEPMQKSQQNDIFSTFGEVGFYANQIQYMMDFQIKKEILTPPEVLELQKHVKGVQEYATGTLYVPKSSIGQIKIKGLSLRQIDKLLVAAYLEGGAKKPVPENAEQRLKLCERRSNLLGFQTAPPSARMIEELLNAPTKEPGSKLCVARLLFAMGEYAKSLPLFEAEGKLDDGSVEIRNLAWAHFYAGDAAGAIREMTRFQKGNTPNTLRDIDEAALLQRLGKAMPSAQQEVAKQFPDGPWPRPLLAMQAGIYSAEQLLAIINHYPAHMREYASSIAWFYIAQQRLAKGNKQAAMQALAWYKSHGIRSSPLQSQVFNEIARLRGTDQNYREGLAALEKNDVANAIKKLRASAEAGLAPAQCGLAGLYYHGDKIDKDLSQAVHWLQKAAAQQDADALGMLGAMLEKGEGIAADMTAAAKAYQQAADLGHKYAQYYYAVYLQETSTKEITQPRIAHYLMLAAEQDIPEAQGHVALMYFSGKGLEKNYDLAFFWGQFAAHAGNIYGMQVLSQLYGNGLSVPKDEAKALHYTKLGAEKGDAQAQQRLGGGVSVWQGDTTRFCASQAVV